MMDVWDFGHYQLRDEFIRQQGVKYLPFNNQELDQALHERRFYLSEHAGI